MIVQIKLHFGRMPKGLVNARRESLSRTNHMQAGKRLTWEPDFAFPFVSILMRDLLSQAPSIGSCTPRPSFPTRFAFWLTLG